MADRGKWFDYREKPLAATTADSGAPIARTTGVGTRLLVVEDDTATRFAIDAFFRSIGYHVDAVSDAENAARLIDAQPYDVVITDLQLSETSDEDGMEIVSRSRRRSPHACIVMLTAFGSETAEGDARRRGADLFRIKPIGLRDLSVFIDRVLRRDHAASAFPVRER